MKQSFILLMDSLGQGFRKGRVSQAGLSSPCLEPQLEDLKLGIGIMQLSEGSFTLHVHV